MDFNLNGCASTLAAISLCDIQNGLSPTEFGSLFGPISWELHIDGGATVSLGQGLELFDVTSNNAGLFPLTGTEFPAIGSYLIELVIDYTGAEFIYEGISISNNGTPLMSTDDLTLYIVNISSPPMLALFGLGWGFTVWRRRRKK